MAYEQKKTLIFDTNLHIVNAYSYMNENHL